MSTGRAERLRDQTRCADERRRALVRAAPDLNGLDYLEVSHDQRRLTVFFLDQAPTDLLPGNFRIGGGRRVRDISVTSLDVCAHQDPERDDCLTLDLDRPGDFSCYRLEVVETDDHGHPTDRPHHAFDPRYWWLDLDFKVGCPTGLDCGCPPSEPVVWPKPEIRYLARDYEGFRQLLLDRLALTAPDWVDRHAPDLQVMLVEVLAYVADRLSYYQDAVATEAYLRTARLRTSIRRHARLVDYRMHEGCTSWTWLTLESDTDLTLEDPRLGFLTSLRDRYAWVGAQVRPTDLGRIDPADYVWFEPSSPGPIEVLAARSEIDLYTWQDGECCLPAGSTRATLVEPAPAGTGDDEGDGSDGGDERSEGDAASAEVADPLGLEVGDVLVLVEVLGPRTGVPEDADPRHRHAVRLTGVRRGVDPLTGTAYVEVEWGAADALPFDLCLSSVGPPPACAPLTNVSVARGNVVLVDAGRTVEDPLGTVPVLTTQPPCEDGCPDPPLRVAGRYQPRLPQGPLTFRAPVAETGPASTPFSDDPRDAVPVLTLHDGTRAWSPVPDLLASSPEDPHVVVETDDDGGAVLRFGDDVLGRAPRAGATFGSRYRVGSGPAGNVGADTIAHLVSQDTVDGADLRIGNPLPARGGTAPEPVADVRLFAPTAFRDDRQRAVTAEDYAELAQRDFSTTVQRAAADLRWNGSWYEARVAVDALGSAQAPPALLEQVAADLEHYRRIAHDLRVVPARSVGLDITLLVCVSPHHRRADVARELSERLGSRRRPDGSLGLFHPDAVTFGTPVAVSTLVAEAAAVEGVDSVSLTQLQRSDGVDDGALASGVLLLRPDEVPRVDSDPGAPENGVLHLDLRGGR